MASNQEEAKGPPMYDEAIRTPIANSDAPPAYDSLVNKIKKAKQESKNPAHFLTSVIAILCGSLFVTVLFGLSICLPIAMIVIGVIYKDDCHIQNKIPIWLIVSGSVGCLSSIIRTSNNCFSLYRQRLNQENEPTSKKGCLTSLVEIFLLAWFICGNVWVYSIRNIVNFDDPSSSLYCHQTVYLFSFWVITVSYILAIFCCCCCCCILMIAGCGLSGLGLANTVAEN